MENNGLQSDKKTLCGNTNFCKDVQSRMLDRKKKVDIPHLTFCSTPTCTGLHNVIEGHLQVRILMSKVDLNKLNRNAIHNCPFHLTYFAIYPRRRSLLRVSSPVVPILISPA